MTPSVEELRGTTAAQNKTAHPAPKKGYRTITVEITPAVKKIDNTKCHVCGDRFTWFNHRHHCRFCVEAVCHSCSRTRKALRPYTAPKRVCDTCVKKHWLVTKPTACNNHHDGALCVSTSGVDADPVAGAAMATISQGVPDAAGSSDTSFVAPPSDMLIPSPPTPAQRLGKTNGESGVGPLSVGGGVLLSSLISSSRLQAAHNAPRIPSPMNNNEEEKAGEDDEDEEEATSQPVGRVPLSSPISNGRLDSTGDEPSTSSPGDDRGKMTSEKGDEEEVKAGEANEEGDGENMAGSLTVGRVPLSSPMPVGRLGIARGDSSTSSPVYDSDETTGKKDGEEEVKAEEAKEEEEDGKNVAGSLKLERVPLSSPMSIGGFDGARDDPSVSSPVNNNEEEKAEDEAKVEEADEEIEEKVGEEVDEEEEARSLPFGRGPFSSPFSIGRTDSECGAPPTSSPVNNNEEGKAEDEAKVEEAEEAEEEEEAEAREWGDGRLSDVKLPVWTGVAISGFAIAAGVAAAVLAVRVFGRASK